MSEQEKEIEEREAIIGEGANLRADLIGLLTDVYTYRPGFIIGGRKVSELEKRFSQLHGKFLLYDGEIFLFLSESKIAPGGNNAWHMEIRQMGSQKLLAQRQIIQSLLDSINGNLSNAHNQLINKRAIFVALIALAASIILGLISIYVAYMSSPIILYPVK